MHNAAQVNKVPAVEKAIGVVESSRNEQLALLVMDHIMDAMEGADRDELRLKLNIAMGRYDEAARDALEIARFEQVAGLA